MSFQIEKEIKLPEMAKVLNYEGRADWGLFTIAYKGRYIQIIYANDFGIESMWLTPINGSGSKSSIDTIEKALLELKSTNSVKEVEK